MECPLCSQYGKFFLEGDRRQYWLCPNCGLIFVPGRYYISREQEVERYLEHENSLENEGYVRMFQEKIDLIKRYCPGVKSALDFGCGYEPVLKTLLLREGIEAEGYDPYFFPDTDRTKTYDLVVSTETFEHLSQPAREIEKTLGRLHAKGYLAVMTQFYPAKKNTNEPCAQEFSKWYYKRDPTHIVFFGGETLDWITRRWNLEIVFNNQKDFVIWRKRGD